MSFTEVMLRVLPPVNGQQPHITGHYGEQRANGPHGGTDFNYIGGQSGLNLNYPKVYAPIAGIVSFAGGAYGTIKIKDADGNSHEILHTSNHVVNVGTTVAAGDEIGAMGGQGPNDAAQYPRHVHYQMKGPTGALINPELWWGEQAETINTPPQVVSTDLNFQFPIRKDNGKQFADAEEVYKALDAETSGHYLLGSNKFWHGGIHITDQSAPQCVLNEPVRCVADGEVVAYRLNEDYLESTFGDNEKKLKYSNSFCLVRHEYKSAPNPEEGPDKGKQNTLNFYSWYMHLLPYNRYPLSEREKPTPKITMTVNDFRAYDVFPEVNETPSPGKLSTGTKLEVLEQKAVGNITYARGKILSGAVTNGARKIREAGAEVWFAYLKDGVPYQNSERKNIWKADKIVERLRPNYWQGKVNATAVNKLNLYQDPAAPKHGQLVGPRFGTMQLIPGSVVEFDSRDVLNLTLNGFMRKMAKCTKISGDLAGAGTAPSVFWACVENQRDYRIVDWTTLTPTSFNAVEMASTGIKAGDPIGYLGLTENLTGEEGGVLSKYQVHIEIFTTEEGVRDFLRNVAGLKSGKQYVHLAAGTELKQKSPTTGVTLLKNQHAVELSKASVINDGAEDWYEVSIVDHGQLVSGLVNKAEADIVTQHDWEKLGFQIVEENNPAADGFLDPEDTPQFFKNIFARIDANHDGELDPGELADARKSAEIRNQWTKLIAYHPTEWRYKADAAKWSKLDQLLEDSPKTLQHEKERIDNYMFWADLGPQGGIETSLTYHFHPIEFVEGLLGFNDDSNLKWLEVRRGQLTFDVEGNDLDDPLNPLHRYFSRKVHWPGGVSGITIGRGYDLGQRPTPEADLLSVGIKEPLLGWLLGSKGLRGSQARDYLNSARRDITGIFITRRQQHELFVKIYDFMRNEIIRISDKSDTVELYGRLNWDSLDPKIQDMAVDLIYRGDYTGSSRSFIQQHMASNNLSAFSSVIRDRSKWGNVPEDRFNRRVDYLR
jgi:hypothetical protein